MKRAASLRGLVGYTVFCASVTTATAASAQSRESLESITAEALFDEGVRLMAIEQYELACPRLQSSYELDPGTGTLLYLADCYRSVGKKASAWMAFREASFAAAEAGQREREQAATAYAQALQPQLILLHLQMESIPPEVELLFDGHPLQPEVIGVPFAVDPGSHTVQLSAPGRQTQQKVITLEDEPGVVAVELPQLAPTPPPVVERTPEPPRPGPIIDAPSWHDSLGWALLGAGASAVLVGGGLAVWSDNQRTGLGVLAGGALGAGAGAVVLFRSTRGDTAVGLSAGRHGGTLVASKAF